MGVNKRGRESEKDRAIDIHTTVIDLIKREQNLNKKSINKKEIGLNFMGHFDMANI